MDAGKFDNLFLFDQAAGIKSNTLNPGRASEISKLWNNVEQTQVNSFVMIYTINICMFQYLWY